MRMKLKLTNSCQITGRWSGFRQNLINMVRVLVNSSESTYYLWRDPNQGVDLQEVQQAARDILNGDRYHFGQTASVSTYVADRVVLTEPQLQLGCYQQDYPVPTFRNVCGTRTFL